MRSDMEFWKEIRQQVLTNELSRRAACQKYHLGWHTLEKILAHDEPPGYRRAKPRAKPKIDGFLPVIHEILQQDRQAPKKQRHTAWRIFQRLRDEHQFPGQYTIVKDAVRAWKQSHQEVFLPLSHPPGEAQVDFGEATIRLAGQETKVALFVMTLPYSGAIFLQAFPRECTETFLEGHRRALEFFGGVPRRISYDNSAIAVIEVRQGRERKLTREFLRLQSHYLFQEHFCLVRRPNEKGHVERLLGFAQEFSGTGAPRRFAGVAQRATPPALSGRSGPADTWQIRSQERSARRRSSRLPAVAKTIFRGAAHRPSLGRFAVLGAV